jgi:hypothetical protein
MENNIDSAKSITFWELINQYKIEIPIIQRDYAQGREEFETIRHNFLDVLKGAIEKKEHLNLDFVYGNVNKSEDGIPVFQPLDGQQRLTTLFLLHWYSYKIEYPNDTSIRDVLLHFTYETRISSREFCQQLIKQPLKIEEKEKLSSIITDSRWFFLSWTQDGTIRAMLNMIDDIHERFYSQPNLWSTLTKENQISFYYLILKDFGLSDDLYIKMNARGKLLTPFENFKAEIQAKIKHKKWENVSDISNSFAYKLDTEWTDFIWNNYKYEHSVDIAHMRFIAALILINTALGSLSIKSEQRNEIIQKIQDNNNLNNMVQYVNEEAYKYIYECYNLYSKVKVDDLALPFPLWRHTPKFSLTREVLIEGTNPKNDTSSYTHKVLFFAQTEYIRQYSTLEKGHYLDWMRVIRNIVSRGDVDADGKRPDLVRSPDTFVGAINLVSELASGCGDIYHYLATTDVKSTFAKEQMNEEKLKALIIDKNPEYKQLIFSTEDNELLRGKIIFALKCAGYNDNIESIDWTLMRKICVVFNTYFNSEAGLTDDLRRAMLTIENDGKYEFYNYWWSYWNVGEANKHKLFVQFREIEYFIGKDDSAEYFKKLVLLLTEKTYRQIIDEFNPPENMPNWKIKLIKDDSLLNKQCPSKYIAIPADNKCCYLLKSKRPRELDGGIKIS